MIQALATSTQLEIWQLLLSDKLLHAYKSVSHTSHSIMQRVGPTPGVKQQEGSEAWLRCSSIVARQVGCQPNLVN